MIKFKKYFSIGLKRFPNLLFEPIGFVTKYNIIIILEYAAYTNDHVKRDVLDNLNSVKVKKFLQSSFVILSSNLCFN